ncbi:hypothetical protein [Microbacterium sp. NPDC056569]|uniref:hypothetical protein n=1 Tax=Microbacterium sp. NPDC056569 TaxID=3345867 RepID=UPI0036708EF6
MKHSRALAAASAASAALLLALGAPAAVAAPPEIDHWTEHIEHIEQEEHEDWCPDIPYDVLYTEDAHGTFRGVERHGVFYGASTIRREASWMNTENGKVFSSVWQGQEKDQRVADNGDGTLTITILFTGPTQYYDDDGRKLFKDVGRTFATILVDADGEFLEFLGGDSKGQFDTADRDFCADLRAVVD